MRLESRALSPSDEPMVRPEPSDGGVRTMADGPVRCLFWRMVDELDYLLTLARLRILDALAGPLPEAPADQRRDSERIESPRSTVSWL
jgi:hypothetical protein